MRPATHRALIAALLTGMTAALIGCAGPSARDPDGNSTGGSTGAVQTDPVQAGEAVELRAQVARIAPGAPAEAGAAMLALGTDLLGATDASANAVVGPTSVFTVLAMASAGARERTAEQLAEYLGGDADAQQAVVTAIDRAVADAVAAGEPFPGDPEYTDARPFTFQTANSLWSDPTLTVRPDYLDALAGGFDTGMFQVDFRSSDEAAEAARQAINAWVAERTASLIPELLAQRVITVDTVLALVNATYLSAPWQTEFVTPDVVRPFRLATGGTVQVALMTATGGYPLGRGDGWTSVTVPYRGGRLAMTVVLPDEGAFDAVRADLPAVLTAAGRAGYGGAVNLSLPAFGMTTAVDLTEHLQARGVTDLFDERADLSGIAGDPGDIFASHLVHQAVISVDEQGTEAAAATALVAVASGAPAEPVPFVVDGSFLFAVHDTTTLAPLFLGQVIDPTA